MVHTLFVTGAVSYSRAARDMTQIETGSRLTPIGRAPACCARTSRGCCARRSSAVCGARAGGGLAESMDSQIS
jgi:hypothetical protein